MSSYGKMAAVNYRGFTLDGEQVDGNDGQPLFRFRLGVGEVTPGFDRAVASLQVGEEGTFVLDPIDAFGLRDEDAVQRVPAGSFPNGENLPVGQLVRINSPKTAAPGYAKVLENDGFAVTLDFNHPLAGETLTYWIQLVSLD